MRKYFNWMLVSCLLIATSFFIYLENGVYLVFEEEVLEELFDDIKTTPALPDKFIATLEKHYPNKFQQGVWGSIFSQIIGKPKNKCACREIYFPHWKQNKFRPAEILALELDGKFTQRKCYEYNLNTTVFNSSIIGFESAAKYYYNKDIDELEENEILELDIKKINPILYNDDNKLNEALKKLIEQQ